MNKLPLSNLILLNTRPIHQAGPLNRLLQSQGARTINLPTLAIKASDAAPIKIACQQLESTDMAIFVSANAVHCSQTYWPNPFPTPTLIAIGPGTEKALTQFNLTNAIVPEKYSSEGILALACLGNLQNKKIMIFCGKHPRPFLQESLRDGGAEVTLCECYERFCPPIDDKSVSLLQQNSIHGIISTSKESLLNLKSILNESSLDLKAVPLIVISQGMADLAKTQGWENIIMAANASDQAITEAASKLMRY